MHGDWAVDGFIILSGFVIAKLISEKPEPYLGYISRRFFRLYPVYLICLALAVLLLSPRLDPGLLVSHLALAQGLLTGSGSTAILVPSWSISLEWQYYLIAPAFVAVLWRLRWRWVLVLALVLYLPICRHWDDIFLSHWPMQSFLPMKLLYFMAGVILYRVLPNGLGLPLPAWLRPVQYLGKISYSTYLVHYPVLILIAPYFKPHAAFVILAFGAPLIIGLSAALFLLVETPGIRLGRRLSSLYETARLSH